MIEHSTLFIVPYLYWSVDFSPPPISFLKTTCKPAIQLLRNAKLDDGLFYEFTESFCNPSLIRKT